MNLEPIGVFRGEFGQRAEAPRQGAFGGGEGVVELLPGRNFETALRDLEGFERVWLLFLFHKNSSWRPTAAPPLAAPGKPRVGVFASRAPYRPNPLGLSCVRLQKIEGLRVFVSEADLLDGSPVLDLKPYVPAADAFPEARAGWAEAQAAETWEVLTTETFERENSLCVKLGSTDLGAFARRQLSRSPFDSGKKRVKVQGGRGVLSFRLFRIMFRVFEGERRLLLERLLSGYTLADLAAAWDPYGDKELHRAFLKAFPQNLEADFEA